MKVTWITTIALGLTAGLLIGCGNHDGHDHDHVKKAKVPAGLIVETASEDAKPIARVKKTAKLGDTVVVQGQIGGSKKPFVAGWASMTIVDISHPSHCRTGTCGCDTPWDFCCGNNEHVPHTASIQVVDANGKPLKGTLEGVGGLQKENLEVVTVEGTISKLDGNTLVINATKIHRKPVNAGPSKAKSTCSSGCTHDH